MTRAVRPLLIEAAGQLRVAGVESPEQDARQLLAYATGVELARLPLLDGVDDAAAAYFQTLIDKRLHRIPLQHLTGRAHFRHLELEVGPGVFVPRPELGDRAGAPDGLRRGTWGVATFAGSG